MSTACSPGHGKRRSFWWSRCRSTFSAKDRRFPRNTFLRLTEDAAAPVVYTQEVVFSVGTWLSLVEHSLGVRGVGSSNLPVPTIKINHLQDYPTCIRQRDQCNFRIPTILHGFWCARRSTSLPSVIRL